MLNINDAPVIESFSPINNNPKIAEDAGTEQIFTISTSDPDEDVLTVEWVSRRRLSSSSTVPNQRSASAWPVNQNRF